MSAINVLNIHQFGQEKHSSDLYSNSFSEHLKRNENLIRTPHKHDFYLCVVFTKGTGIHEIDFNSYKIEAGSVFFLKPGQTHFWKFTSSPEGYIFFHSQEFYNLSFSTKDLTQFPFFYSYKSTPSLHLKTSELKKIVPKFKNINNEFHESLPYKNQKIASLINTTYIDLARHYSIEASNLGLISPHYLSIFRALENNIELYFHTEYTASFYAEKLNISAKHLNRITRETVNKTTTELITDRVILEAKRLIVHSNNQLSKIAELVGYEDYAYFSKVFKSKTKRTPSEFRNDYRNLNS
ncbi:MAG: AraC family transcriptional regulator [Bacteroidetes bacterium MedPE-SWsnd-G1]|nr:MAG: AraC family transcriptional regulator [Bacteroidetes bacterium MedPE-SWsnd-G1]